MTVSIQQYRPFITGIEAENKHWFQRINFKWLLQRMPLLLFAIVSSYGVGHLLDISGLPAPFYQLGGISFDIGFLGVIALADMQLTKTWKSQVAYYALNIVMSSLAALFNTLSHANGKYSNITAENITVGVPFAIVGLLFALYYHSIMDAAIEKEMAATTKAEIEAERIAKLNAEAEERRMRIQLDKEEYEANNPFVCACGKRYAKNTGLSNHKRNCAEYIAQKGI